MTNFDFLKSIDKNLFEIISEAEKLYASEFFEQCTGQTRRFGEQMCKSILSERRMYDGSFDEMISVLKDQATSIPEKEFVEDLYFLKKQGNISVHSSTVKHDGVVALECLQRAFEASINYAVLYKKANKNILKKHYDIELLVTGKRGLNEKYQEAKTKSKAKSKPKEKQNQPKQSYTIKSKSASKKSGLPIFWIFVFGSMLVSAILMIVMLLNQ